MSASQYWKSVPTVDRLFLNVSDCIVALHSFANEQLFLDYSLDALLSITEANAGSILVWDDVRKELTPRAVRGPYSDRVTSARVKLREGISGWVADQGHSILVKNIEDDVRFQDMRRIGEYQSGSFISMPILSGHRLVGVVNITERKDLTPFAEEDFERVSAIVGHIAIAFERIKKESRLVRENEELTETVVRLKEKIKIQEPLVSIGKLASHLAHELNNPLDGIRRFVNLSLDQIKEESLAREYLLKAKGGIRRAIRIIRGLLAFSSHAAKQTAIRIIDGQTVVAEAIKMVQNDNAYHGIRFDYEFCEGRFPVKDCGLVTVFQNLFDNARHAMNESGTITVRTRKDAGRFVVSVADTGCGIPSGVMERVFEPFFTTKDSSRGTGIGLAISRDIIERSGGELSFQSQEGKGTTFTFYLPIDCEGTAAV